MANMASPLGKLEAVSLQDRAIRDGLEALIEKERKLAELELLLRLSQTGAPLGGGASASKESHSQGAKASHRPESALHIYADPTRIPSSYVAPLMNLPSGTLRPRAARPELNSSELALLKGAVPAKSGLDLSKMELHDESVPEIESMLQAMTAESVALRVLDVSSNLFGKGGATALVDCIKRFPRLEAICVEDNELGGKPGVGAIIDIATRAAVMGHIGVSINEAHPLPFSLDIDITPPGVEVAKPAKAKSPGKKDSKAKSSSPSPKKGGKSASPGKKASAGPTASTGTSAQLASCIHAHSTIASVSLAGSVLERDGLIKFLQAWAPPPPKDPPVPGSLSHPAATPAAADASGKGGKGKSPPKKATPAKSKSPAKGSKGGAAPAHSTHKAYTPLLALNLARLHIGALGAQDVGLALGVVPAPHEAAAKLGHLSGGAGAGHAAQAADAGGKPPAAPKSAKDGASKPTAHGLSLHGSLQYLRVLNLSSCGLSSHGVLPVLDAVARHTLCLSHLILRDNFLDDAGAGALATAIRLNHFRVGTFMSDAAELDSCTTPIAQLQGKKSNVPSDRRSDVRKTTAMLYGAGLHFVHASPLRVIDVRNNPLTLSADPQQHPGCQALVDCIEEVPGFLSVTGPAPSVEGILHLRQKALLSKPEPAQDGAGLGDDVLAGWSGSYFLDLAAVAAAAREACTGSANSDPRVLLPMPGKLVHTASRRTLAKVETLLDAIDRARTATAAAQGSLGTDTPTAQVGEDGPSRDETAVLWRLVSPTIGACAHRGLVGSALTSQHSGAKQLSAAQSGEPHDAALAASAPQLGVQMIDAGVPTGMSGHASDSPAVIGGVPTWSLRAPRVYVEWRATYTCPAAMASVAHSYCLVWHVVVAGPGGRPTAHVYSARFTDGSRDRMHARNRMLAKLAGLNVDVKESPGGAAASLTAAVTATSAPGEASNGHGLGFGAASTAFTWQDAAGLDVARALGKHNDVNAALGLPPALAAHALASAGAEVAAWPVAWHCAPLPAHLLYGNANARVSVHAEIVQTGVRGVASALSSANTSIGQPAVYGVHVLEAEVVAVESVHGTSTARRGGVIVARSRGGEGVVMQGTEIPFAF